MTHSVQEIDHQVDQVFAFVIDVGRQLGGCSVFGLSHRLLLNLGVRAQISFFKVCVLFARNEVQEILTVGALVSLG